MTTAKSIIENVAEGPMALDGVANRNGGQAAGQLRTGEWAYEFPSSKGAKEFASYLKKQYGLSVKLVPGDDGYVTAQVNGGSRF